jgi:hypothetical protein
MSSQLVNTVLLKTMVNLPCAYLSHDV